MTRAVTLGFQTDKSAAAYARLAVTAESLGFDGVSAGRMVPDELLTRFAFAGDPEAFAAQAATLFEAGASRVEFGTPHGHTDEHGVELLGKRVLPALKEVL